MDDKFNEALFAQLAAAGVCAVCLVLFRLWGRANERRHEKSLAERERAMSGILLTNLKRPPDAGTRLAPVLVAGATVVASDYFKRFLYSWRKVVGGESKTFTRLYIRARREATLRMLEEAQNLGYDAVCNVRYDAADIGGNTAMTSGKKQNQMAVCMATGTAYTRD